MRCTLWHARRAITKACPLRIVRAPAMNSSRPPEATCGLLTLRYLEPVASRYTKTGIRRPAIIGTPGTVVAAKVPGVSGIRSRSLGKAGVRTNVQKVSGPPHIT